MSPAGRPAPPLPGLPWSSARRRCLRVVDEVGDLAHAARRLHCSQAALEAKLAELQSDLGKQHVQVVDGRVQLSAALQNLIRQRAAGRPATA